MKIVFSYILIWSIFLSSFQNIEVYVGFKLNQTYIAKVLCINKDKPEMGCNGKCHLKKQLKKKTESSQSTTITSNIQLYELMTYNILSLIGKLYSKKNDLFGNYFIEKVAIGSISKVFHPPMS